MSARWVAVCRAGAAGRGMLLYPGVRRRRPSDLVLLLAPATSASRTLHLGRPRLDKELHKPSSKVEESVESLRDQLKGATEPQLAPVETPPPVPPQSAPPPPSAPSQERVPSVLVPEATAERRLAELAPKEPPRRTLWIRFVDEVKHYYHGFKLLFININISRKLIWRVLNGESLSRRENRQVRTENNSRNACTTKLLRWVCT